MYLQCGDIVQSKMQQSRVKHILKTVNTNYDTMLEHFSLMLGEIVEDEERNSLIVNEILNLTGRKILVLSERIEHLNILWHLLDAKGVEAVLIYGGLKSKEKRLQFEKAKSASINLSSTGYHIHNFMRFFIGNDRFLQD